MSTPAQSTPAQSRSEQPRRRARLIVAWAFQMLGAMFFTYAAVGKLTGSNAAAVEAFDQIGLGAWFLVTVAILELLGAIGLLVPSVAGLAGLCLAVLAASAALVEVVIVDGGSPIAALVGLVLAATVGVLRRDAIMQPFDRARRARARG
jgi:putative oxidoreductase